MRGIRPDFNTGGSCHCNGAHPAEFGVEVVAPGVLVARGDVAFSTNTESCTRGLDVPVSKEISVPNTGSFEISVRVTRCIVSGPTTCTFPESTLTVEPLP